MSELSPKAQALVQSGRAAFRPNVDDRQRVLASLRARLPGPTPVTGPRGLWLAASAAALVGVGVAASAWLSTKPATLPSPPALSSQVAPMIAPAPTASVEPAAPAVGSAAPVTSAPSVRRPADRLAEEVALLSQAAKDLRSGRATEALRGLSEHQRRFPNGALTLERRAARAEALCSLSRFAEADAELAALTRVASGSPLTLRARERCTGRPRKSAP